MIELKKCDTYISIHWGIVDFLELPKVLAGQTHDPVVQLVVLLVAQGHMARITIGSDSGDGFEFMATFLA